ncbi:Rhodanese-related sulfurtransferase [gamma proteobacterium HIMB55]|nr:Rhodanese-related sulfurtransferase [gamma proteobacterium HIMB55]
MNTNARQMTRRAFAVKAPLGAFFVALISTLTLGISTAWANDLEIIREGLSSPVIVDVRTEREFGGGALDGAVNHPVQGLPGTLLDMGVELDEEVIVYCRSGRRSAQAKTLLKAAGFKLVFDGGAMSKLEEALEAPKS